ncbi:MAG: glycosyltransferase [bacterium]
MPTRNEIEGLKEIMPRVKKEWIDQIIVIDANSTDGTIEYAREHNYTLVLEKRPGGVRYALPEVMDRIKGDVVITFSPDGNCIPELIPDLIKKMEEGYDMVIVSRYAAGAKSYDDSIITAFGNWLFTTSINILHGGRYTDTMGIFRAYKANLFRDLELDKDGGYSMAEKIFRINVGWEPLLSVRAAKRELKIAEIPGDEPARSGGKSKLRIFRHGAAHLFQVFWEVFFWR